MTKRRSIVRVEIDVQRCTLTYGSSPCTAALGVTGSSKCFNTNGTCQDLDNFDPEDQTLKFSAQPDDLGYIPSVKGFDYQPAVINPGEDLGVRAKCSVTFEDHPHDDAEFDKYHDDRSGIQWTERDIDYERSEILSSLFHGHNFWLAGGIGRLFYSRQAEDWIEVTDDSAVQGLEVLGLCHGPGDTVYLVEVFTEDGTWNWAAAGSPSTVQALVIAGGGRGGTGGTAQGGGGGGGAGGVVYDPAYAVSGNVSVVVGAGGAGTGATPINGEDSSFGTLVATGGGGGASGISGSDGDGAAGGSGGGAANITGGGGDGGSGTGGQGNDGGDGVNAGVLTSQRKGAGGGGAGAAGENATTLVAGAGGIGVEYAEFAEVGGDPPGWFAGGGGGGAAGTPASVGAGGAGGGGAGGIGGGVNGTPNTGGGGGGNGGVASGVGGSGVVFVRYLPPSSDPDPKRVVFSAVAGDLSSFVVASAFMTPAGPTDWEVHDVATASSAGGEVLRLAYSTRSNSVVGVGYDSDDSNLAVAYVSDGPDLDSWTRYTLNNSNFLPLFVFDGAGVLVCGGTFNALSVSVNGGSTWAAKTSNFSGTFPSIRGGCYGRGVYVIVGNGGNIATSSDADTWTQRDGGFGTTHVRGVVDDGEKFVAVGEDGKMATSPNGVTWTQIPAPVPTDMGHIGWDGFKLAVASENGRLDTGVEIDYNPYTLGTYWTKFRARFPYVIGRPMRLITEIREDAYTIESAPRGAQKSGTTEYETSAYVEEGDLQGITLAANTSYSVTLHLIVSRGAGTPGTDDDPTETLSAQLRFTEDLAVGHWDDNPIDSWEDLSGDPAWSAVYNAAGLALNSSETFTVTGTFTTGTNAPSVSLWVRTSLSSDTGLAVPLSLVAGSFLEIVGPSAEIPENVISEETHHFIVEAMALSKNVCTVTGKDVLKMAQGDRAQCPRASSGVLASAIDDDDASLTLEPAGIGDLEYDAAGWFSIGDEIVSYTRSGDTCSITRAQLGTAASGHEEGDTVQQVKHFDSERASDIIAELFTDFADVDPAYIPLTDWNAEDDTFLDRLYSAHIARPVAVEDLVIELIQQCGLMLWFDDVAALIRFKVLRPVTGARRIDERNIVTDSFRWADQPDKRVSQVWTAFRQLNPLEDDAEARNFAVVLADVDLVKQTLYGSARIRQIFSRWIGLGGTPAAQRVNDLFLSRYVDPPRRLQLDLYRGDSDLVAGESFVVEHRSVTDAEGYPLPIPAIAVSVKVTRDRLAVVAEEFTYTQREGDESEFGRIVIIDSDTVADPVTGLGGLNARQLHDRIYPAPDGSTVVTVIVDAGVTVGSTSASRRALDMGSWPAGCTVNLIVRAGASIRGAGGAGVYTTFGDPLPGNPGGVALYTRFPITLTNDGIIAGGGGGGGQGGSWNAGLFFLPGGAGGGGAGHLPGLGAGPAGGTLASQPGTLTTGGAGSAVYQGGAGGDLGQPGEAGGDNGVGAGGAGGAAGAAVDGDSYVTYDTAGTITGPQVG